MSTSGGAPAAVSRRTRILWLAVTAAVVLALVTVVAIGIASARNTAAPGPSPSAPASTADADPTVTPTPAPTDHPATGAPSPGAPAPGNPPIVVTNPLPIEATAKPETGVTVSVGSFEAVEGEAQLPGDVAGPAVRFTLSVTNGTAKTVSLATALVNVYYGAEQLPASELQEPGGVPLPAAVAAGATAQGTLVFTIPEDQRGDVLITVDYQVGEPVIAFQGAIPR